MGYGGIRLIEPFHGPRHRERVGTAWLMFTAAIAATPPAQAQEVGQSHHGSGGPQLGATLLWAPMAGGRRLVAATSGGAGYSYHYDGKLRLGGRGQGSFTSTRDGAYRGRISWGGIMVGSTLLARRRWEVPLWLSVGGGSVAIERTLGHRGELEDVERESHVLAFLSPSIAIEWRVLPVVKLCLEAAYLLGVRRGVVLHGAGLSLAVSFMIPKTAVRRRDPGD